MPRLSHFRLTHEACNKAEVPDNSARLIRCSEIRGLALRVSPIGKKTFVFAYSIAGRERRMTLGEFGPWTLARAKRRAAELRRTVDLGLDPLAEKQQDRDAPNLSDVWVWYQQHFFAKQSEAHKRDLKASWEKHILPHFGSKTKLKEVSKAGIQRFLDNLSQTNGPVLANRCHSHLRSVLQKAVNDGWIDANPARGGIQRNVENGRERYLSREEFVALCRTLEAQRGDPSADAIYVLALTGARKSQTLQMRWADLDLTNAVWFAPAASTKSKKPQKVFLNSKVLAVLQERWMKRQSEVYVFPSNSSSGHLNEVRKTWSSVKAEAKIENCRLHDLRHTFASFLVSDGKSLEVIGAMLGHTQAQTTKRYAHLRDEALKDASESIAFIA